jgi:cell division protein FtsB
VSPRDITGRVLGRPLRSPYGGGGNGSRARWLWLLPAAWLLWVTLLSDHSLWRISRLRSDLVSARTEIQRVRRQTAGLDARLHDPVERTRHAEEALREQGMSRPGEIIYRLGGTRPDSGRSGAPTP